MWGRRPRRTLIGFVALLAVSVGMLVAARLVRGFNSELLLNIGASVVILAFSYVFFDPIFEHARKGRVEERLRFDHEHSTPLTTNSNLPSRTG